MRRTQNQSGFTLIELLVVIAIIAVLASAVAFTVHNGTCTKAIDDAKKAARECKDVLAAGPTIADVAACTAKAQNALNAICTAGCVPGDTLTALVGEANTLLRNYRESLPEGDRTRVVASIGPPC